MSIKAGDKAPAFTGKDQDGNPIKLSDFKGKKVVLYFYPNDDTPGCTAEACNLRDNYSKFKKANYVILGVSANDEKSHRKFIEKFSLPFPLIADTDKTINELYGVWREKNTFGKTYMGTVRTTFIIDENGKIEEVIEKVNNEDHTAQILK
ncbi:MAG TPA: thioredoxin-dependent thiol peroxidase [Cytophagaceae bacterium]|jgi:peroxiredoxin Q/BCP|nr:thioredoxin-dependent thiol peroxidase [Cytophagaceae bacterium]